ncbi:MAG: zincin-like metallopeptidase domain-containing protein [Clostridia bacterium]|nr:zincin-like metallopeptidase domain-containing protein [Clostridia bacterium]
MNAHEKITNIILNKIQSENVLPWQKPWRSSYNGIPFCNGISKRAYTGANPCLLAFQGACAFKSPYFMTFKQVSELGGNVKKGEHGLWITFHSSFEKTNTEVNENGELETDTKKIPFLKLYNVFNVEQCEGLPREKFSIPEDPWFDFVPIAEAEAIVKAFNDKPTVIHSGTKAAYYPDSDTIHIPETTDFIDEEYYYGTLFHEFAHSTGHKSRLNREIKNKFGSEKYSHEELVAELCAAMLCAECGITNQIDNSAAYIQGWMQVLQKDKRMFLSAATLASKAADWISKKNITKEESIAC